MWYFLSTIIGNSKTDFKTDFSGNFETMRISLIDMMFTRNSNEKKTSYICGCQYNLYILNVKPTDLEDRMCMCILFIFGAFSRMHLQSQQNRKMATTNL